MSDFTQGSGEIPAKDFLLRSLVQLVNTTPEFALGLTLSVKGVLITGIAVGWKEYFDHSIREFKSSVSPSGVQGSMGLALVMEVIRDWQKEWEEEKPEAVRDPHFIHLRDARYLIAGQLVPTEGSWWRGRLSEVDGFNIGSLEVPT